MEQALIVLTNVPDAELARSLAQTLVERRLAACVNIMPAIQSVYRWQGVVEHATELTLMIKSTQARYVELEAAIVEVHPYDVPEVIALPIAAGLPAYLNWIVAETGKELNV
ncbi:divalent-cation tolerance protein CutA [Herbaspirillum sp. RV1423]|uniref:divalent-cation tolerance protein CutA n=1 Tax=Herbaspirillum sp. RV1423 TaxID=1443993 RepID=UPI0004B753B1|nr:divalent-cation tolerance protein CutA [Herbaspirillum sp. RV1423]